MILNRCYNKSSFFNRCSPNFEIMGNTGKSKATGKVKKLLQNGGEGTIMDNYSIGLLSLVVLYVDVSQIIHKFCDEHLFRQVSTSTGCNQLPIFCCTNVHLRRHTRPHFKRAFLDDVMSQSELTTFGNN